MGPATYRRGYNRDNPSNWPVCLKENTNSPNTNVLGHLSSFLY